MMRCCPVQVIRTNQKTILAGLMIGLSLVLAGCGVQDGGELTVGQTVSNENIAAIVYQGAIIEDTMVFGPTEILGEFKSKDSTDYLRYVFEITNETNDEVIASKLLPLKAGIISPSSTNNDSNAEPITTPLSNPRYIAQDQQTFTDQTIASRATDTISVVYEITPEEAKETESIEATVQIGDTSYTISGSTIQDATPYQQLTADIAESFSTLLNTTYQNACLNANTNMYSNPIGAFQGIQSAASSAAAEIKTDIERFSSVSIPPSYEDGKSAFEATLTMFQEYFSQVAAIDPSNPSACNATIKQLNTTMETQLPQFYADIKTACEAMPYLELTDYYNLEIYFSSMISYNVSYFEY